MAVDFAKLYEQLGVQADCSLEDFKRSCRRLMREQHPDRSAPDRIAGVGEIPLSEWLPLYATALRFHRKYGRLPGAPPPRAASPARTAPAGTAIVPAAIPWAPQKPAAPAPNGRHRGLLLSLLAAAAVLALLYLIGNASPDAKAGREEEAPAASAAGPEHAKTQAAPKPAMLELGMEADEVHRIQGPPLERDGSDWIYGPSWLRFDNGRLVDWYSSPLRPLKTPAASPYSDPEPGSDDDPD
jgi:hypothetical protein